MNNEVEPRGPELGGEKGREASREDREKLRDKIEQGEKTRHEMADKAEKIRVAVRHEAKPKAATKLESDESASQHSRAADQVVHDIDKKAAYTQTMKRIRKRLNPASRVGSRIIHQPVVNAVSEVTGKTVARPSGLLIGGLVAFVGTGIYYYRSTQHTTTYNFTVFFILLAAGLVAGWILEAFFKLFRGSN